VPPATKLLYTKNAFDFNAVITMLTSFSGDACGVWTYKNHMHRKCATTKHRHIKIVVLGEQGVGKTALTMQYVSNLKCWVHNYDPTVEDVYRKQFALDGEPTLLDIFDTAGRDEFCVMRDTALRETHGFVVVFDITRRISFDAMTAMMEQIRHVRAVDYGPMVVCGNKVDLVVENFKREVSTFEAQDLARKWGAEYFETSAKLGSISIDGAFLFVARAVVNPPVIRFAVVQKLALLVCSGNRHSPTSVLSQLPRDVAALIAQMVLKSYNDIALWKSIVDLENGKNKTKKCDGGKCVVQ
jgi:GTPase KRas protein